MEGASEAIDAAGKAKTIHNVVCALKENRLEIAVFTLLLYSVGAIDKAMAYGTGLCM